MMTSLRFRKSAKIVERMYELADEMKEFHRHSEEIMKICSDLVRKVKETEDFDSFLELYATVYRYLSSCSASFFEFNCRMETLRMGTDSCPPYLPVGKSPREVDFHREGKVASVKSSNERIKMSMGTQSDLEENCIPEVEIHQGENSSYKEAVDSTPRLIDWQECNAVKESSDWKLPEAEKSREENPDQNHKDQCISLTLDGETLTKKERVHINLTQMEFDRSVGALHEVILSWIVSPDEFYVYVKCEDLKKMEDLKEDLRKIVREGGVHLYNRSSLSQNSKKKLASKMLGEYALGFSKELSTWTRIKILDWRMEKSDDLVQAFRIDHGTSCLLPLTEILPMSSSAKNYPIFTQKCYLPGISPIGKEWSEEDKIIFEIFTESTEQKNEMGIGITEVDTNRVDGAIGVNLFLPESRISVNDKLIEFGVAVERDARTKGRFLPPYEVGERIPVKVTYISKMNHIFCVKDYSRMNEKDILQYLIELLNGPGNLMAELENPPKVGDFVIAKYKDGLWYRAQVVKSNLELDCWRVTFLDYGNTESVSVNDFRKIEENHLKMPFQMIECFLEEIEPKLQGDQQWGAAYLDERTAEDATIEIRRVIDGVRSLYGVRLFDSMGEDIVEDLISAEIAIRSKKVLTCEEKSSVV